MQAERLLVFGTSWRAETQKISRFLSGRMYAKLPFFSFEEISLSLLLFFRRDSSSNSVLFLLRHWGREGERGLMERHGDDNAREMESFRMVGRSLKFYRDRFRGKPRKSVDYASKL